MRSLVYLLFLLLLTACSVTQNTPSTSIAGEYVYEVNTEFVQSYKNTLKIETDHNVVQTEVSRDTVVRSGTWKRYGPYVRCKINNRGNTRRFTLRKVNDSLLTGQAADYIKVR